jgi:dolichyl-phosphate-mannose--protein O-mannosyl transferase
MPRVLAIGQGALNAIVLLVPAFGVYLLGWLGWITGSDGWGRNAKPSWYASLWDYHLNAYAFHTGLTSPHPYQANAFEWLLSLRPTALFFERYEASSACGVLTDCTVALTAIPNLVIWLGGLLAIIWLGLRNIRKFDAGSFGLVTGFLAGWLPWVFYLERTTFQFYAVAYAPYLVLALAFGMHVYWRKGVARRLKGRHGALVVLMVAVVLFAIYFLSIWMALPVPHFVWRMQMLFPFWV